jgi:hypothetical protein
LVTVKHNTETHEFETLDQAMEWAKAIGEFVTIEFDGKQVVGVFGAAGVVEGKCPNGEVYTWKKRRRS